MTIYKRIPGFPAYYAGDDGSIWSSYRIGCRGGISAHRHRLKIYTGKKDGRQTVKLYRNRGSSCTKLVAGLVLKAFVGPRPFGYETLHADGNSCNNALTNLRWGTHVENGLDARRHGKTKGERHYAAKLTDKLVSAIRARAAAGESQAAIARSLGLSRITILNVVHFRSWSHVR